eukprot:CAMPEP_0118649658 /NCGR_PEP_ID=MMETSP0785-20121206/9821_1 /TAXON_ID=91992 /ORGANISM="Bolidomonas pacifica, Strain CCMP 1866" /LENGTH=95 /DNA_ID=CAMNT_0006541961 /DNA_START=14 /DNA_END=301 /DNA_ORIENTATION=+
MNAVAEISRGKSEKSTTIFSAQAISSVIPPFAFSKSRMLPPVVEAHTSPDFVKAMLSMHVVVGTILPIIAFGSFRTLGSSTAHSQTSNIPFPALR